jgi:long-chain acyl-CoA synthetase
VSAAGGPRLDPAPPDRGDPAGTAEAGPIVAGPPLDPRIVELTGGTVVELFDRAVARTPGHIAVALRRGSVDERWTYRELHARSLGLSAALVGRGVRPGDRVVTWGPNDPWLVAALFAAWRVGGVVVPLDLRMMEDVVERIAARTEPVLVLAGEAQAGAAARIIGVPVVRLVAEPDPGASVGDAVAAPDPSAFAPVTPGMLAEIVCTSGTTSDPKGVCLTHGQLLHNARVIAQTGIGPGPERGLAIIPFSHMYGQMVPLFLGLISGSTLVFLHAVTASSVAETLRRERITALTTIPQLTRLLLDAVEAGAARRGRLPLFRRMLRIGPLLPIRLRRGLFRAAHEALGGSLRIITSGGAALPVDLQRAWEAMGVIVVQGYGGTECAAITGHTRRSRRPGTAGRPLAGLEVRIAADGEILVRGPNVMAGYWRAPEATAEVLDRDGWLHTGDAGRFDDHGELVIEGRTRDRIALPNGLKVYPDDVELALRETRVVREAVVFEASPGRLAAVLLPVAPDASDAALAAAVKAANATLAVHQRVDAWRRWPEADLPRTHTLKVRRDPVKAWYREAVVDPR